MEDDEEWEDDGRDDTAEETPPARTEAPESLSQIGRGPAAMRKNASSTACLYSRKKHRTHEEIRRQRRRRHAAEYFDDPPSFKGILNGVSFAFWYTLNVVWHQTLRFPRRPLCFLAFLWALAFLFGETSDALQVVVQPLCFISGISHTPLCAHHTRVPKHADFSALVEIESTFEQLLDDFVHVSLLSSGIKTAERSVSDLHIFVHDTNHENIEHFSNLRSNFIGTAKETAIELEILIFNVQDAVDR